MSFLDKKDLILFTVVCAAVFTLNKKEQDVVIGVNISGEIIPFLQLLYPNQ